MNIDVNILNQNIHKPNHNQVGFIPRMHNWINIQKAINIIYHIQRIKNKNHTINPLSIEKEFHKIQNTFNDNTLKLRTEGN